MPKQYYDRQDCAELYRDLKEAPIRRREIGRKIWRDVKLQKFIKQYKMSRGAYRKPFRNSLHYSENYCFNQSTDYAEIVLGNTGECGGTVEIRMDSPDGDLLATIDTYGGKDEQNSGRSYTKAIDLAIYRLHDIYIVWKNRKCPKWVASCFWV